MSAQGMDALMDGLVADARASRDASINQLDAVQRESQRANVRLAGQLKEYGEAHDAAAQALERAVAALPKEPELDSGPVEPPRAVDTRFLPEDEWEAGPGRLPAGEQSAPPAPTPARSIRANDDLDDDDFVETWLR